MTADTPCPCGDYDDEIEALHAEIERLQARLDKCVALCRFENDLTSDQRRKFEEGQPRNIFEDYDE